MLRHTFVFLAFTLTLSAAQAGTPAGTGSAVQANVKKPAEPVKTSAAVKQAPKPVEVKKPEAKVTAEPKAAVQPKSVPNSKTADTKAPTAANAKTTEPKPAANAKTAEIKAAPAAKTAVIKPAPNAKTTVVKPAPSAKTAEAKKENDKSKTAKSEGNVKEIGRAEHVREQRLIRAGLVPPPPPETPAVLSAPDGSGFYMMQGFLPVETLGPDALRARQKQLTSQLQNVKDILKDRQSRLSDKTDRAKQFDGLYQEGVISRRELEASQEDIKTAQRDFDDAKSRVDDLQMALNRVDEKLKSIAKYGLHSNKRFAAGDKKRSKSKATDVSAQAVQAGGTKTALKPASVHQIYSSAAQSAPSAAPTKAASPASASTDSTSAPAPAPVADPASQPTPEAQADTSAQLAAPGPAQAAR